MKSLYRKIAKRLQRRSEGVLGYISESELRRIRRRFDLNNQEEFDILKVSERGTE